MMSSMTCSISLHLSTLMKSEKLKSVNFFSLKSLSLATFSAQGEVQMEPSKVSAVTEWSVPINFKQLQSFLGFDNFCGRFIKNYSHLAAPLTALTSTSYPFCWSPEA